MTIFQQETTSQSNSKLRVKKIFMKFSKIPILFSWWWVDLKKKQWRSRTASNQFYYVMGRRMKSLGKLFEPLNVYLKGQKFVENLWPLPIFLFFTNAWVYAENWVKYLKKYKPVEFGHDEQTKIYQKITISYESTLKMKK